MATRLVGRGAEAPNSSHSAPPAPHAPLSAFAAVAAVAAACKRQPADRQNARSLDPNVLLVLANLLPSVTLLLCPTSAQASEKPSLHGANEKALRTLQPSRADSLVAWPQLPPGRLRGEPHAASPHASRCCHRRCHASLKPRPKTHRADRSSRPTPATPSLSRLLARCDSKRTQHHASRYRCACGVRQCAFFGVVVHADRRIT